MTEQQAVKVELDGKAIMIDSAHFTGVYYGIHPNGAGISIITGRNEIRVRADNIDEFLQELYEIAAVYISRKKTA